MKQGTPEWLEFRKNHIGASDQTHLQMCAKWSMGWKKLWAIKTGRAREQAAGPHMLAGIEAEPRARSLYEAHVLIFEGVSATFNPHVVEHEFLSASLDGYSTTLNRIIEVKTPGAEDHETAVSNKIPAKYIPQLTQQSLLMGKIPVDYVSYRDDQIAIVTFKPTDEHYEAVLETAKKFWEFVITDTEPDRDYPSPLFSTRPKHSENSEALLEAKENCHLRNELDEIKAKLEASNERLLKLVPDSKAVIGPVEITTRAGIRSIRRAT